eukprot:COSAG02_NODE_2607_length_8436_cov_3.451841_11_plen_108_part_00
MARRRPRSPCSCSRWMTCAHSCPSVSLASTAAEMIVLVLHRDLMWRSECVVIRATVNPCCGAICQELVGGEGAERAMSLSVSHREAIAAARLTPFASGCIQIQRVET